MLNMFTLRNLKVNTNYLSTLIPFRREARNMKSFAKVRTIPKITTGGYLMTANYMIKLIAQILLGKSGNENNLNL